MLKKTNLQTIDFNRLYKEQKLTSTFKPKDSKDWDKKADEMNERVKRSDYNQAFFSLVNLEDAQTLLDVGCGVGNLSLTFAPYLKKIYSFDYSDRMLDLVKENSKLANIDNIEIFKQDIEQPWSAPQADIVIASRSVGVIELESVLKKLNNHALKRVYVAVMAGGSFVSNEILEVLDSDIIPKPDYIYLVNILHSLGIYASVNFIDTYSRKSNYANEEEFIQAIKWSIGDLSQKDEENLREYFQALPKDKNGDRLSPNPTKWAIVSWEKTKDFKE